LEPLDKSINVNIENRDFPVFKFQDRIISQRNKVLSSSNKGELTEPSKRIGFVGGSVAYLSKWHENLIINKLLQEKEGKSRNFNYKQTLELELGDYILFRGSGDKEFIQIIAEEMVGKEIYMNKRALAEQWKKSLHFLGENYAEVTRRLAENGLSRTQVTIRGWFVEVNRIGPGNLDDIDIIAKVSKDRELLKNIKEIKKAITFIRGAHLSAGNQLTGLLIDELGGYTSNISEQETYLDLGFADAWVVQIEWIDSEWVDCPIGQLNKIIRGEDDPF